ncbi:hypothetical protein J2W25_001315 [Variovorax boronicumulans]|uniref:Uncharacterized protein n=1 Tax=Variovorax boronicumulans TaxID=436515 RepID=A0AAW8DRW4_9BURK|nr:hypothetical protein [Variovorax boronicumulans]MDP9876823.1 hypothetical protein [Variovorax boronicumulans]MDP9922300.1 hypothetical protein [Variovorax boronicumulans]
METANSSGARDALEMPYGAMREADSTDVPCQLCATARRAGLAHGEGPRQNPPFLFQRPFFQTPRTATINLPGENTIQ